MKIHELVSCWACPAGRSACSSSPPASPPTAGVDNHGLSEDFKNTVSTNKQASVTNGNASSSGNGNCKPHEFPTTSESIQDKHMENVLLHRENILNIEEKNTLFTQEQVDCFDVSQSLSTSRNYSTFESRGKTHLPLGPTYYCPHSGGEGKKPALFIEYCERILPTRCCTSGRSPSDEHAIVGPWRTRTLRLLHASHEVVCKWHTALWAAISGQFRMTVNENIVMHILFYFDYSVMFIDPRDNF